MSELPLSMADPVTRLTEAIKRINVRDAEIAELRTQLAAERERADRFKLELHLVRTVSDAALTAAKERADRAERLVKDLKRLGEEAFTGLNLYKAENRQLECALTAAKADVDGLRKLLWLRHGCGIHVLYGDDGEMQCGKCLIDFKRHSLESISKRFQEINRRAIDAARAEKGEQKG